MLAQWSMSLARNRAFALSLSAVSGALALVAIACASLKDAAPAAPADVDAAADGGPGTTTTPPGSEGGMTGGDAQVDGGGSGGNGDPRWPSWPLPADAPGNASYTISNGADGAIIVDKVTGLGWEDSVPTTGRTFDEATAYCDTLVYDGQSDWRLPTRIEAISVMSFQPTFDGSSVTPAAFADVPGAMCFWTASRDPQTATNAYALDVATVSPFAMDSKCAARCVRGGAALGAPIAKQYTITVDTVTDPTTGLVWEKTPPGTDAPFATADARCKALVLDGHTMRLPGVKELSSIVDETKHDPASAAVFGDFAVRMFTSNVQWTVDFTNGSTTQGPDGFSHASRCVSGP